MSYKTTELIELPSRGKLYPEGHPLHNKQTVEIRLLNASDEDMLTSKSIIKSGEIDNILVSNVLIDKSIDINSLLIGDKEAILIFTRIYGIGSDYKSVAMCKHCRETAEYEFDISTVPTKLLDEEPIVPFTNEFEFETSKGTKLKFMLPTVKLAREIREDIEAQEKFNKKMNITGIETNATTSYIHMIKSVNGNSEKKAIVDFVKNGGFSLKEVREFKKHLKEITPTVEFKSEFYCVHCGNINEEVALGFNPSFFWADI